MGTSSAPVGGERTWLDGAATLVDKLGVGQLINSVGQMIVSEVIRVRREMAAQQASNGNHAGAQDVVNPPSGQTPQPGQTALPATAGGTVVGAGSPPAEAMPSAVATDQPATTVTVEEKAILQVVVDKMRGYDNDEDATKLEERVARAADAMRKLPQSELDQLLPLPTLILLNLLLSTNSDWADIADFQDGSGFIFTLKEKLAESPAEQGTNGDVAELLPLVAVDQQIEEGSNVERET